MYPMEREAAILSNLNIYVTKVDKITTQVISSDEQLV